MRRLSGKAVVRNISNGRFQNAVNEGEDIWPEIPARNWQASWKGGPNRLSECWQIPPRYIQDSSCFYRFDDLNAELPDGGGLFCGDEGQG